MIVRKRMTLERFNKNEKLDRYAHFDIRNPVAYRNRQINGATNIPANVFIARMGYRNLPKKGRVVIYGTSADIDLVEKYLDTISADQLPNHITFVVVAN